MFDKRLMKMCPESKRYIVGNVIFQWAELFTNAVMISVIGAFIDALYEKKITANFISINLFILFTALILRCFATYGATRMSYFASKTVKRTMREQIYKKLLRMGNSYREHVTTAELVQESVEGVEQLESYFGQYVPQFFYAFLAPLTLFFMFGVAGSFKVAAILLVCVPLIPGAIMMVQKIAKKLLSKYWDQYTKLGSTFLENLQGMTTLKTYKADSYKNDQMNAESENFRVVTMKVLTMQLNSIIIMDFFAYGGAALGIAVAGRAFIEGKIGLGAVVFMLLLSADFFLPMRRLGSYFHVAMNGMAASNKIFNFLSENEPDNKEKDFPKDITEIVLHDVSFTYDSEREVLHDVSMNFKVGEFTGIVGESGSGKSTIASIIMGRNTVQNGEVSINGVYVSEINEEKLLKNITYVGLGSVFFKGTVKENLLIAKADATDEELWSVLEDCDLADLFKNEKGLYTELTENAGNLSGGQKQRLSLARALLHNSPIYIFDEATSNIDAESEEDILNEIKRLSKTKTIIMITHRLANVISADKIYCLENGTIKGAGIHEQLLEKCPEYRHLWNTQKELEDFRKEARNHE
ncbi:ATP-binding cassette, subfamily C [Butyrivibrio proteoclasticus]|uniref:ATP-binding cassette, subfamily C n=1 Tax=Butyrivibrio proteoclasticus TaxID=43305 RepID=A0A1I5XAV4_9FIRM|nr:ABC transporter ATP-binding protein/permease [Butyrivibrio proteoclasticus]SFQ29024.1 ATP-binding cassette, subfamily C [Butyrivibrio proteoclasticus]